MILDELEAPARRLWVLTREESKEWATATQDQMRLAARLSERQSDSQAFFAGAAATWDKLREELYGRQFTAAALLALLPAEWVVADLGCGTGQTAAQLAPHVRRVIGVDNSPAMLKAAGRRTEGHANVDLRRGDLEALPIADGECDAAFLLLGLTYVADPRAVLREARRTLRPDGRLVVVDLLPHDREEFRRQMQQLHRGFEVAEVERMLAGAGFGSASCRPLAPEAGAKGPALFVAAAVRPPGR
jgi:ArsR family transcriptional regulator